MIVSIEEEKKTDNIQYPFMIKTCSRTGVRGNFLNLIKDIYKKKEKNLVLAGAASTIKHIRHD